MKTNLIILACVLAVLCQRQTVFEGRRVRRFLEGIGVFFLLLLPGCVLFSDAGFLVPWQNAAYVGGFSLSVVLLVVFEPNWERRWPLLLAWTVFPLLQAPVSLGFWLTVIIAEFLLFLAHQDEDKGSDYYKYALIRLLIIFQFFIFEGLFFRPAFPRASEFFACLFLGLHLLSLLRVMMRINPRRPVTWLFLLAYLHFYMQVAMRLWTVWGIN